MSSTSRTMSSAITITFDTGYDLNIAPSTCRTRRLGPGPSSRRLTTRHHHHQANPTSSLAVGFISPDQIASQAFISNYIDVYVKDAIKRVPGVGDALSSANAIRDAPVRDPSRLAPAALPHSMSPVRYQSKT